ncbi:hypothetical protein WK60_10905 [Burkholderia ubonensis]|uniref:Uncharacterized protein n=1 Tax=Burkholderia ubonensis TaxID=101571 RepID=A0AAU8UAB5_9BURK|nr:hypothetical protein WK67_08150 [Burkholderia ubonensis]KVT94559.1 hypothetical protein WK60_10905 [Burkholderia ubonensis]
MQLMLSQSLDEFQRLLRQRNAMRFLRFHTSSRDVPNASKQIEFIPRRAADLATSGCGEYQEEQGGTSAIRKLVFCEVACDEFGDLAPGHGRLVFRFGRLFGEDVIDDRDGICCDMTMRPCPLHHCVHALASAARRFRLR